MLWTKGKMSSTVSISGTYLISLLVPSPNPLGWQLYLVGFETVQKVKVRVFSHQHMLSGTKQLTLSFEDAWVLPIRWQKHKKWILQPSTHVIKVQYDKNTFFFFFSQTGLCWIELCVQSQLSFLSWLALVMTLHPCGALKFTCNLILFRIVGMNDWGWPE